MILVNYSRSAVMEGFNLHPVHSQRTRQLKDPLACICLISISIDLYDDVLLFANTDSVFDRWVEVGLNGLEELLGYSHRTGQRAFDGS